MKVGIVGTGFVGATAGYAHVITAGDSGSTGGQRLTSEDGLMKEPSHAPGAARRSMKMREVLSERR